MDAEDRHDIMEVKSFVDSKKHEVKQFVQVFGKGKKDEFFLGVALLVEKLTNPMTGQTNTRELPLEFPFPEGTTLKKAFETFDEVAKVHVDEYTKVRKERYAAMRKEKSIVTAGAMPNLKVVGPNGKPIGG